jgi:hypothetical protein
VIIIFVAVGVVLCCVGLFAVMKRRRDTGDPNFSLGAVSTQWLTDHREGR